MPSRFPVLQSSSKAALLGEATANLAEYAEAFKPSAVTLPLKGSPAPGALLHVSTDLSPLLKSLRRFPVTPVTATRSRFLI